MTPYEARFDVTTTADNQVVSARYPGRCTLDRITVVTAADGSFTVDLYNRAFNGPVVPVHLITNDGNGSCYLQLDLPFPCKLGDLVAVTASPAGGYNTNHRVTEIVDDYNVVTDQSWTADAFGGSAQVQIPSAEQELYRVTTQLSGASPQESDLGVVYVNQDPRPNANIGVHRRIYLKFSATGTYRVALRSHESVAMGG